MGPKIGTQSAALAWRMRHAKTRVLDLMRAGADAMVPVVEAKMRAFRPGS